MAYQEKRRVRRKVTSELSEHYRNIISMLGEDSTREGLVKTPERIAKAMQYLTHGYTMNANEILESALFREDVSENGHREGYRIIQHVRAPYATVLRKAYYLDPQRLYNRFEQDSPCG